MTNWTKILELEKAVKHKMGDSAIASPTLFTDLRLNAGGQQKFYELAPFDQLNRKDSSKWLLGCGGIGSGKSFLGACWIISRALLAPQVRGLISAVNYGQLARSTLVTLVEVCRKFDVPIEPYRESVEDCALAIANAQRCYIGEERGFVYVLSANTFLGNSQSSRGLQCYYAWLDEYAYCTEQAFLTLDGRVGRGENPIGIKGQGVITTTPKGFNWLYSRFGDPNRDEKLQKLFKMVVIPTRENIENLGEDYIESLDANYDSELARQELEGVFLNTQSGIVYKHFNRYRHCLTDKDAELLEYDRHLPLLLTFDFNFNPSICLMAQQRGNEIHFFNEIYLLEADIWELTERIVGWLETNGLPSEIHIFGDATGRARTAQSRLSSWDIVYQGLTPITKQMGDGYLIRKFGDSNPNVINRIHSVNRFFSQDRGYIHSRNCPKTIADLEQVEWNNDKLAKEENPLLTHLTDAMGYLIHRLFPFRSDVITPRMATKKAKGLPG